MRIATLALLLLSGCQGTYVAGMGGTQRWPDTNNSDDVEAATDPGWMAGVAAGQRLAFDGWHLRLEGELAHRQNDVHGRNNPRVSGIDALGEEIDVTSLLVNAWPGWRIYGPVSLYAGGGLGAARVDTFGEDEYGLAGQIGLGSTADWGQWTLDIGYRYFAVTPTNHDGAEATYDSHGPVLKLIYTWQ
jgi:opacity protein-like surface antigen